MKIIDHELKIACYTDHQLFERNHKYNLRSEKARNGQLALSLKEIVQLQYGDTRSHRIWGRTFWRCSNRNQRETQEVIKIITKT